MPGLALCSGHLCFHYVSIMFPGKKQCGLVLNIGKIKTKYSDSSLNLQYVVVDFQRNLLESAAQFKPSKILSHFAFIISNCNI